MERSVVEPRRKASAQLAICANQGSGAAGWPCLSTVGDTFASLGGQGEAYASLGP